MNMKEKFYQKIQEATMSQLRDRLMPDRTNDAYKMAKKNIDSKLEMDNIQKDPKLALGYDTLKDKDTGILNIGREERKGTWGSFDPSKKSISVNKKDAQYPNKPISDERFKATTTHEIGHAASERLNPLNKKNGKYYYGNMPLKYDSQNSNTGTEELRQRRSDLTYRTGKPREDSLKWTTALHDRDQQALDKINDTDRNKARQILYKKYGAADRSTMTDRDLGKTATGTIIPEEIKMDIKKNFHNKLQTIREEAEVKPNRNRRVKDTQDAAEKALGHLKKNDYEGAHRRVKGTPLAKNLRTHLNNAQKHWTEANELNNSSTEAKSEKHYNEIRNRANDHQDRAEHHHGKAVEYLEDHLPAEQLDELHGYRGNQKLLGQLFKRANKRAADAAWKDPKTAKRERETAENAWDRFDEKNK